MKRLMLFIALLSGFSALAAKLPAMEIPILTGSVWQRDVVAKELSETMVRLAHAHDNQDFYSSNEEVQKLFDMVVVMPFGGSIAAPWYEPLARRGTSVYGLASLLIMSSGAYYFSPTGWGMTKKLPASLLAAAAGYFLGNKGAASLKERLGSRERKTLNSSALSTLRLIRATCRNEALVGFYSKIDSLKPIARVLANKNVREAFSRWAVRRLCQLNPWLLSWSCYDDAAAYMMDYLADLYEEIEIVEKGVQAPVPSGLPVGFYAARKELAKTVRAYYEGKHEAARKATSLALLKA